MGINRVLLIAALMVGLSSSAWAEPVLSLVEENGNVLVRTQSTPRRVLRESIDQPHPNLIAPPDPTTENGYLVNTYRFATENAFNYIFEGDFNTFFEQTTDESAGAWCMPDMNDPTCVVLPNLAPANDPGVAYTSDYAVVQAIEAMNAVDGETFEFYVLYPSNVAFDVMWTYDAGSGCFNSTQGPPACDPEKDGNGYLVLGIPGPCLPDAPGVITVLDNGNVTFVTNFTVTRDPANSPLAITSPPALPSPQATPTFAMNATDGNANYTAVNVPVSATVNDPSNASPHTVIWTNQTIYNTSGGPGVPPYYLDTDNLPLLTPPTFDGTSDTSQSITWQSLGGLVELAALAEIGEGTLGDDLVADCANIFGVTGTSIPSTTITPMLDNLYHSHVNDNASTVPYINNSNFTSSLMEGVAGYESTYQQFAGPNQVLTFNFQPGETYYDIFPYTIFPIAPAGGWWPLEGKSAGSHIGLMQVGPPLAFSGYQDAWDWTVNSTDGVVKVFAQYAHPAAVRFMNYARNGYVSKSSRAKTRIQKYDNLPPLTSSQLEDNALVFYNAEGLLLNDPKANLFLLYWVPYCSGNTISKDNTSFCAAKGGWTWQPGSSSSALTYRNSVRDCVADPSSCGD